MSPTEVVWAKEVVAGDKPPRYGVGCLCGVARLAFIVGLGLVPDRGGTGYKEVVAGDKPPRYGVGCLCGVARLAFIVGLGLVPDRDGTGYKEVVAGDKPPRYVTTMKCNCPFIERGQA